MICHHARVEHRKKNGIHRTAVQILWKLTDLNKHQRGVIVKIRGTANVRHHHP